MTESQMRQLVMGTFAAGWRAARPDVPLWLENEAQPTADLFVRLIITPTTSQQTTMGQVGNRRVRRNLWLQVKMWAAQDVGSVQLADLGDAAQKLLEQKSFPSPVVPDEPVTTYTAQSQGSPSVQGRWMMSLMRIPAWYAEMK